MQVEPSILVCFAVKQEGKFFKPPQTPRASVEVLLTGMGARNAEITLRARLAKTPPALVLSAGFAGGLNPALTIGTVLFDSPHDIKLANVLTEAGAQQARFSISNRVVTTAEEKKHLREKTGDDAVEMESRIICAICREKQILCATVRVVLDTAGEDLPIDFNRFLTPDERLDMPKLILAVLTHPALIPDLLRMRNQSDFAAKRLADALSRAIEQYSNGIG